MNYDNKNFILAIVLSMLIIFGWQYFYAAPLQEKLATQQTQTGQAQTGQAQTGQAGTTGQTAAGGAVPGSIAASAPVTREQALAQAPRIRIETDYVAGSINLQGAQIDDLHLLRYRESIDPTSPTITFLSPAGTPGALFAEQGFVPATGTLAKLPDSKTVWTAPADAVLSEANPVTLTWDNGEGLVFTRKIEIGEQYLFTVTQTVENRSGVPVAMIPYARIQRQDTPPVAGYWVFFEGMLGWLNGSLQEVHYSDVAEQKEPQKVDTTGGWLGFTDKYWAAAIVPSQVKSVTASFIHTKANGRDFYQTDYLAKEALVVAPGASASHQDLFFAGAKVVSTINAIELNHQIQGFNYMIDWGWFYFLTKPFFYLLDWIKGIVGNFGLAILIATVLVKLAVFPLANKSYASMSKMKKLQPEMEKLKVEYPDDRMKQQQAMMELYKREKVSPLSGCLPVVVQIPIFFALYKVILTSIELRHAPFFGWVQDLSAPDPTSLFNLFGLIPWTPPLMLMIGVWPIIMGITMWLQMRLNPTPPDPVQASLFNWMPVLFTFMLGTFPVGLVIYWAWSNTLSILQQSYIMRRHGVEIDFFGNIRESLPFLKKKAAS
jgi:YidC/Oxa1 family membrane protein insertase